jgi:hypothetical protein
MRMFFLRSTCVNHAKIYNIQQSEAGVVRQLRHTLTQNCVQFCDIKISKNGTNLNETSFTDGPLSNLYYHFE